MRLTISALLILVCVSLLSLQISGLHQHAGTQAVNADTPGTHLHDINTDGHEHDSEIDISFFELGVTWSKTLPFLVALVSLLLVISRTAQLVLFPNYERLKPRKRSRWRPPLRAPPLHA